MDPTWLKRRLPGFGRQIDADKAAGVVAFTICRPTHLYPENCIPALNRLRTLAASKGVSLIIVTYAKKQFSVAEAKGNPYAAVCYAKKLEPATDGAGTLISSGDATYSIFFKEKNSTVRTFHRVISFPVAPVVPNQPEASANSLKRVQDQKEAALTIRPSQERAQGAPGLDGIYVGLFCIALLLILAIVRC
jgi:hypothetical protein